MKKLVVILCILFAVLGCAFRGDVYVAIHWLGNDPLNMPTAINHDITGLPATVGAITPGAYYLVLPGSYYFETDYGGTLRSITFTLTAKAAVLGVEDNYYDIVCMPTINPIIQQVPTF